MSFDRDVRDAIATLIEHLPEGEKGLHYYRTFKEDTEQSCLVVIAFDNHKVLKLMEMVGLLEERDVS